MALTPDSACQIHIAKHLQFWHLWSTICSARQAVVKSRHPKIVLGIGIRRWNPNLSPIYSASASTSKRGQKLKLLINNQQCLPSTIQKLSRCCIIFATSLRAVSQDLQAPQTKRLKVAGANKLWRGQSANILSTARLKFRPYLHQHNLILVWLLVIVETCCMDSARTSLIAPTSAEVTPLINNLQRSSSSSQKLPT